MKRYIVFVMMALALVSCKKAQPDGSKYQAAPALETSTGTVQFGYKGGSSSVNVSASGDVEAKANCDWLTVSVSGNEVNLSTPANKTIETRYAVVTVKADDKVKDVQVVQFGMSSKYLWDDEYTVSGEGGTLTLYYDSDVTVRVKVKNADWVSADLADGTLVITVEKNPKSEAREATIEWKAGEDERTLVVKQSAGGAVFFREDFEDEESVDNWMFADADGDGYTWEYSAVAAAHSGVGVMVSASYINNVGALTPNNWLVTPEIKLSTDNYVSFWVTGQDPSWNKEHYGVYVCDKTPETISDFTQIYEATNPVTDPYEEEDLTFETSSGSKTLTWQRIAVKIPSSYDGKAVYIAFCHFNCTDMFYLNLDDVMVSAGLPEKTASSASSVSSVKPVRNLVSLDFKR